MTELVRDRLVPFEGAHNFRDLGGYPSHLGGFTRWGVLYRAGGLHLMTEGDLAEFDRLGIGTVIDLRRDDERELMPDPMPTVHICLMSRVIENRPMPAHGTLVDHDHGVAFMQSLYAGLLEHAAIEIGGLFRAVAAADGTPTVFHCTAGKDRTGTVAALLLLWLGVDREDVLDDFELTDRYVTREHHEALFQRMLERGMGPEAAAGMLAAPRASMAAALDLLDATYGGIEAYLRGPAGVDDATLARVRGLLLD
jgi:protein-tyrosine phosphatase